MPSPRFALALFAAVSLNGSVALALPQPACAAAAPMVCALPLDGSLQRVSLPEAAPVAADAWTGTVAELAPPVRPADLHARHARAATTAAEEMDDQRPMANHAPPRRPVHLHRMPAPAL